jgi:NAD(P)-dependent dehydrogenase (short-subunit alcohol dehydrogenase family)
MTDTARPTVAITGASGALGQALLRQWQRRGARLIALTSREGGLDVCAAADPAAGDVALRQVCWRAGGESDLAPLLQEVDVLVINHGLNVRGRHDAEAVSASLEVNALSGLRLLELYADLVRRRRQDPAFAGRPLPEVWVNTSEAEVQPALSPAYEISKRLLGQLVSLRALELASTVRIRRLVLGPFRSNLNPIGVMDADWVAAQILRQAGWGWNLIIVTINPLTYFTMPLTALGRWLYFRVLAPRSAGDAAGPPR